MRYCFCATHLSTPYRRPRHRRGHLMSTPRWLFRTCFIFFLAVATPTWAAIEYAVIDLGAGAQVFGVDPQGNGLGALHGVATLFTPQPIPLTTFAHSETSTARGRDGLHGTVGIADSGVQTPQHAFLRQNGRVRDLGTVNGDPMLGSEA